MRWTLIAAGAWLATALGGAPALAGEIYGTVHTRDGAAYTGPVRWDKNENFWDDLLDATKGERIRGTQEGEGLDLRIFGIQLFRSRRGQGPEWVDAQFSVPFGHIRSLEPGEKNRVAIELKNGRQFLVRESGDLGSSMRGLVVHDGTAGETILEWDDLRRVEFHSGPASEKPMERLYGTVVTSIGEFTGYIAWDKDEALLSDILDGKEGGRKVELPFRQIRSIENAGGGARVRTVSGQTMTLTGSNDVNNQNRGIEITIVYMGKVIVPWSQFRSVTFEPPPPSTPYEAFDGGRPLYGSLTTSDGSRYTGEIVWDNDEAWTWESLDGGIGGIDFLVLFEHIAMVERASLQTARVTMREGLAFELGGSNDVNHKNKGIRVRMAGGEEVEDKWGEFQKVVFTES